MILLAFIIFILIIIIFNIKSLYGWWHKTAEGFDNGTIIKEVPPVASINNEIEQIKAPDVLVDSIAPCKKTDYPLLQYAIKGSYNTAVSGLYVSTQMIKYVISRGCRFLDFEVYIEEQGNKPNSPAVAIVAVSNSVRHTSTNNNRNIQLDSINTIKLSNALNACLTSAFTSSKSPNYTDPLFIQLRINTSAKSIAPIVDAIKYGLKERRYIDASGNAIAVNENTVLKDILGKIILVVDSTGVPKPIWDTLKPHINMVVNTAQIHKYYYKDIDHIVKNPPHIDISGNYSTTDIKKLSILVPSFGVAVPSPFTVYADYGIQTMLVPFSTKHNSNIVKYEQLFNTTKGGIVPLSFVLSYSNDYLVNNAVEEK